MSTKTMSGRGEEAWTFFSRTVFVTGLLLLVPYMAMQFTTEVDWTTGDFVAAAILLIGTGSLYAIMLWLVGNSRARLAAGILLTLALLAVWVELAVGIFD